MLPSSLVWIERVVVFVTTVAASVGWADSSATTTVAAGGTGAVIVFVQVLASIVTHARAANHTGKHEGVGT